MTTPANASAIESKSNVRGAAFVVILTTLALFGGYRLMLHLETIRAVKTAPLAVSFDEPGMIADVLARDGEFVRAGQPLLAIADEVMPEQIDALNTELRLARAEMATSAATSRWAVSSDLAVADQLDNRVEHLESRLAEIRSKTPIHFLTAPVAGRVLRVHRFTGERISRGEILVDIVPEN